MSHFLVDNPATTLENTIVPSDDAVTALTAQAHSPTHTAQLLKALDSDGTVVWRVKPSGNGIIELVVVQDPNDAGALLVGGLAQAVPVLSVIGAVDAGGNSVSETDIGDPAASGGVSWSLAATDDPSVLNPTASVNLSNPIGASASYTSRVDLRANDHAANGGGGGRIALSYGANGSAPMAGAFGSLAAQQVGASAAGIAAITDPNAKAAVTALQHALAALGYVTAPA